jgi:hypothetical protein
LKKKYKNETETQFQPEIITKEVTLIENSLRRRWQRKGISGCENVKDNPDEDNKKWEGVQLRDQTPDTCRVHLNHHVFGV